MSVFRLVAAFLIAPWVPVVAYYAFYFALSSSAGRGRPSASAFLVGLVPVAYLAVLVAWLPFVLILRRSNTKPALPLAIGGTVLGVIVGTAGMAAGGVPIVDEAAIRFLAIAAMMGLCFGAAFWAIAMAR